MGNAYRAVRVNEAALAFEVRRKFLHLIPLVFPLASTLGILDRFQLLLILGITAIFTLVLDIARRRYAPVGNAFAKIFGSFLRQGEKENPIASTHFFIGMFLSALLFPSPIAEAGMYILVVGDTMAAVVGMAWGRPRFRGKSLEGSFAFLVSSFVILSIVGGLALPIILAGAVAGTIVELLPLPVNDNLTIPVLAGLSMFLASNLM
jgi:glycerol-3-phosphate acyltransferase PlsY